MLFVQRTSFGQGYISGYICIFLGVLRLFSILCFHFPEVFTTPQFREVYTGEMMKQLLMNVIITSIFFTSLSFLLSQKKKLALTGIILSALATLLGGFQVGPAL